jgi:hypothetical protein
VLTVSPHTPRTRLHYSELTSGSSLSSGASAASAEGQAQCSSKEDVDAAYAIIKTKIDITSGGDGYGMTGNCTQGSMAHLLEFMQSKCDLDESAMFMDLGHGMGRPTIHAALLRPHIAAAFGTEFNPALYKQSMLALAECDSQIKSLQEKPRIFFLDANIKHFATLCPFTHVYAFQIGMPKDVIDHMFHLLARSKSVKCVVVVATAAVVVVQNVLLA